MNNIGNIIRSERMRQNLTCRELGKLSETSAATVSRLENNKRIPRIKTAMKILAALGIEEIPIIEEHKEPNAKIVNPNGLIPTLENAIMLTNGTDPYSVGMKNGMIYALSLITGSTPVFDDSLKGEKIDE